jgi:hypothetical protein
MVVMCHRYLREHQAEPAYAKDVARAAGVMPITHGFRL